MDGRGFAEGLQAYIIIYVIVAVVGGIAVWELLKWLFHHVVIGLR
jgi:hypothetical protein